ncbi:Fasciclin domain-containing protein [Cephalotus follicularis]|uniref:Fasciclin domain-containing protein n=1 Tax=Cephalotus follicularis TaxID=3775 RepID=A0A1Q3AM65_CEPFO|nr:Fasciclin domain-containing protein [Cephalotus follicularis]
MLRILFLKNPIAFVLLVVSLCCLLVMFVTMLRLPEVSLGNKAAGYYRTPKNRLDFYHDGLGKFGDMMIEMLPEDLAFTVFVPSEKAFERDLRLRVSDSLVGEKMNDTYAVVSRVLGFSAVPRTLSSATIPVGEAVSYDSISGFALYISKDVDGMLVVNRIRSDKVDIKKRKIVVHVMDGVIMDAEFEQSVQPE